MAQKVSLDYLPYIRAFQNMLEKVDLQLSQCVFILIAVVRPYKDGVLMHQLHVLDVVSYEKQVL